MNDILIRKYSIWNNRLKKCLTDKKYTQTAFADAINKLSDHKSQITQKTVSRWMRTGEKSGTTIIGFPKYENMILIAEVLGVDLGYLTGETNMKTFTKKAICEYLHLAESSVDSITKLTIKPKERIYYGYWSAECRGALNQLLSAQEFQPFIAGLAELQSCSFRQRNIWIELEREFGEAILEKAFNAYTSTTDYKHDPDAPNLPDDVVKAYMKIDATIDEERNLSYSYKISRYELNEIYQRLIDELFPQKVNK